MTEEKKLGDAELDAVFAQAVENTPAPSSVLLDSIMADAEQVASLREADAVAARTAPKPGFLAGLLNSIGGWPAIGGLVSATVAGVWIGYASPATVDGLTDGYLASQTYQDLGDFLPSLDAMFVEG